MGIHLLKIRWEKSLYIYLSPLLLIPLLILSSHFISFCGKALENSPPLSDAGEDIQAILGEEVTLDASLSSDPEGGELFYFWNFDQTPLGSGITNEDLSTNETPDAVNPSFTPDVEGFYAVSLQVSDGSSMSDYDYVVVSIYLDNIPPVAIVEEPPGAIVEEAVTLNGSQSYDPEGDYLSYLWGFVVVPEASSLTDADIYNPGTSNPVIIPDVSGTYIVSLIVNDGFTDSDPAYGVLKAESGNSAPVADAGEGQIITPCGGMDAYLDGSGSYDPDGDSITYEWTFVMTPTGSSLTDADINDSDTASPSFTGDIPGLYVIQLIVNDGTDDSSPDSVGVLITEDDYNSAPVAEAGSSQTIEISVTCSFDGYEYDCPDCDSQTTTIDGSASYDLNYDPLTYSWSVTSGSATIADSTAASTTVTMPSFETEYGSTASTSATLSLTVSDCYESSSPDTMSITVYCTGN